MITFLSPYRTDKNIGRAYNESVSAAPDGWVCITDYDAMFLLPDAKARIIDVCENTPPGDYLYSVMTNRLNMSMCSHQLYEGWCSEDPNIMNHLDIANKMHSDKRVTQCSLVAGVCLIFRKSTWEKAKFKENTNLFDQLFSKDVMRIGGQLGIIKGVYIFHLYRMGQKNPSSYTKHLI